MKVSTQILNREWFLTIIASNADIASNAETVNETA